MLEKIIVVFKTHLDVGFTDFSEMVVRKYVRQYIPQAMKLAREMREAGGDRFIWSTGSWIISQFLKRATPENRALMEDAIRQGDIAWHGLPFTTHSEIMNPELFEYGLSISKKLDQQFGKKTIAAKMTDVPGHTKGIVPLMAKAGLEFLHIGVNPASSAPEVPELFRWQCGDREITVMYNKGAYGKFTPIGDGSSAVYFAHTNDNQGPQSAENILKVYRQLREEYPGAQIVAGTLDDVAVEVRKFHDTLPIVREEIGDNWIFGASSAPKRVSQYRAMLRLLPALSQQEREKAEEFLIMVPEHTWGLTEDGFVHDHENMVRTEFEKARSSKISYQMMELSWKEQNQYVADAADALSGDARVKAQQALAQYCRPKLDLTSYEELNISSEPITAGSYTIHFQQNGAIDFLSCGDRVLADQEHLLCQVVYELFSKQEQDRFFQQYVIDQTMGWAREDFGKLGLEKAISSYQAHRPAMTGLYRKGNQFAAVLQFPEETRALFGAPEQAALLVDLEPGTVRFDFAWWDKHANRTPEAFWMGMCPIASGLEIQKLGQWIRPDQVVSGGSRQLHGMDRGIRYQDLSIDSLDAVTVAVEKPSLWNFTNEIPDESKGVWFNLFNNLWGTNFTMWYEEDARFRWVLHC